MGIAPFELTPEHKSIPNLIKNRSMANIVYLIKHNPSKGKQSHMSIIIDLAGESNEKQIRGLMLHVIVDRPVQMVPAVTKFDHLTYVVEKCDVEHYVIGKLESSAYFLYLHKIPNTLKNLLVPTDPSFPGEYTNLIVTQFYAKLCSTRATPNERANLCLIPLGQIVYGELIERNSGITHWSSAVNCQQYARLLIEFGLGLQWPDSVDVAGDVAPEIIDIAVFYQSLAAKYHDK